jgi:subfamily B ATP-binding cassette protein MsbA
MKKNIYFIKLLKPYRYLIAGSIVSLIIFANLGLALPWMLKIIIDRVLGASDFGLLYAILGSIILIYAMRSIFFYISHYFLFYISQRLMFDIRKMLFKHLQNLSLRFYTEYRAGKLISNIISDVARLEQMIFASLATVAMNAFVIVFITGVLFVMSPKIALICLALIPLQLVNFMYFRKIMQAQQIDLSEKMSEISANLAETINGVRVVKTFAKERTENRNFVSQLRPVLDLTININMNSVYLWILAEAISILCILVVLAAGGSMVMNGSMTIGEFVAFYTYLGMLLGPIVAISGLSTTISNGLAGASRIMTLLNTIPEIVECENPVALKEMKGELSFKDVTFGYNGKSVIKRFSLDIAPGRKIAFVGPSGSGKSTIANLLLRFYDVNSGSITVDGHDIRTLALESYREKIGVVLQEPFLFSGTIEENIAYAREDATHDEIVSAAKMANVEEFVKNLEKGYKTEIGENGAMLSGGQKQRIAIARAILNNPKMLILDEATSSLDTVSEFLVQDALDHLMRNRTTIIIAHRLSTIKNADLIVAMENGEIKQAGTHDELIEEEGVYRQMYLSQEERAFRRITGKIMIDDQEGDCAEFPEGEALTEVDIHEKYEVSEEKRKKLSANKHASIFKPLGRNPKIKNC